MSGWLSSQAWSEEKLIYESKIYMIAYILGYKVLGFGTLKLFAIVYNILMIF